MTRAANQVRLHLDEMFPGEIAFGRKNCRKIRNSSEWSQHAFYGSGDPDSNALDIHAADQGLPLAAQQEILDRVRSYLFRNNAELRLSSSGNSWNARTVEDGLGIKRLIWRQPGHHDHIHIDFWPTGRSRSSCSSEYEATFKSSRGRTIESTDPDPEGSLPDGSQPPTQPPDGGAQGPMSDLKTLRRGDADPQVIRIRAMLEGLGFPTAIEGFGPELDAAVRLFQLSEAIEVDGVVGPITWGRLLAAGNS